MNTLKGLTAAVANRDVLRASASSLLLLQRQPHRGISMRANVRLGTYRETASDHGDWPRKIFSGIQPTGALHLGNYLGAVRKWTELQNAKEDVTFCIVDMHSLTSRQEPIALRENIFQMAAALLACGIDPEQSTIFVQSAVKEHTELAWILGCMTTMARLGHLPQYKDKTRMVKEVPLGLFVYPVLQAADIMLYKATHVPVGEDQVQHIQLAQHLARTFNARYGPTFPVCHALLSERNAARIRSLRDPSKKMSKSDGDPRSVINLTDDSDVIVEKVKKAVTDFCSDVHYSPDTRQGVSNLIAIHSMLTGKSIGEIVEESTSIDTGKYKMRVAEAIVDHLHPIRNKINHQLARRKELVYLLEMGAEKARQTAAQTLCEVKQRLGIGAHPSMPILFETKDEMKVVAVQTPSTPVAEKKRIGDVEVPVVPKQQLRVEKKRQMRIEIKHEVKMDLFGPQGKLDVKPMVPKAASPSKSSDAAPIIIPMTKALVPKSKPTPTTGTTATTASANTTTDNSEATKATDKQQKEVKI